MGEPPDHDQVLAAGQVLVDGGVLAGEADALADVVGLRRRRRCPSTVARPASGRRIVVKIRTAVVLPAPFGPSRPSTVPVGTREVDAVDGDDVAEALREPFGLDGYVVHGAPLAQMLESCQ